MPPPSRLQQRDSVAIPEDLRITLGQVTGGCRDEFMRKAKKETPPDTRIWCHHCCVRISPNEDQVADGENVYHIHCVSKQSPTKKNKKKSRR